MAPAADRDESPCASCQSDGRLAPGIQAASSLVRWPANLRLSEPASGGRPLQTAYSQIEPPRKDAVLDRIEQEVLRGVVLFALHHPTRLPEGLPGDGGQIGRDRALDPEVLQHVATSRL